MEGRKPVKRGPKKTLRPSWHSGEQTHLNTNSLNPNAQEQDLFLLIPCIAVMLYSFAILSLRNSSNFSKNQIGWHKGFQGDARAERHFPTPLKHPVRYVVPLHDLHHPTRYTVPRPLCAQRKTKNKAEGGCLLSVLVCRTTLLNKTPHSPVAPFRLARILALKPSTSVCPCSSHPSRGSPVAGMGTS